MLSFLWSSLIMYTVSIVSMVLSLIMYTVCTIITSTATHVIDKISVRSLYAKVVATGAT